MPSESFFFQGDLKEKQREKEQAEEENFGDSKWGLLRTWLWNTMEYPWTSKLAQVRREALRKRLTYLQGLAGIIADALTHALFVFFCFSCSCKKMIKR